MKKKSVYFSLIQRRRIGFVLTTKHKFQIALRSFNIENTFIISYCFKNSFEFGMLSFLLIIKITSDLNCLLITNIRENEVCPHIFQKQQHLLEK